MKLFKKHVTPMLETSIQRVLTANEFELLHNFIGAVYTYVTPVKQLEQRLTEYGDYTEMDATTEVIRNCIFVKLANPKNRDPLRDFDDYHAAKSHLIDLCNSILKYGNIARNEETIIALLNPDSTKIVYVSQGHLTGIIGALIDNFYNNILYWLSVWVKMDMINVLAIGNNVYRFGVSDMAWDISEIVNIGEVTITTNLRLDLHQYPISILFMEYMAESIQKCGANWRIETFYHDVWRTLSPIIDRIKSKFEMPPLL